jgi:hypothetical protein
MTRPGRYTFSLYLVLGLLQVSACSHYDTYVVSTEVIGTVTHSEGFPSVIRNSRSYILAEQSKLFPGDIVTTDELSLAHLQLKNGAMIKLGTRSRLRISDYRSLTEYNRCIAVLTSGSVEITGQPRQPTDFSIETTIGHIGTRSAHFWMGYNRKKTALRVVSLSDLGVKVSNIDGHVDLLRPFDTTEIVAGAAPANVRSWSEARFREHRASHLRISR